MGDREEQDLTSCLQVFSLQHGLPVGETEQVQRGLNFCASSIATSSSHHSKNKQTGRRRARATVPSKKITESSTTQAGHILVGLFWPVPLTPARKEGPGFQDTSPLGLPASPLHAQPQGNATDQPSQLCREGSGKEALNHLTAPKHTKGKVWR